MQPLFPAAAILLGFLKLAAAEVSTLTVYHLGHHLHGKKIQAAAQGFYTGLSGPSTYCPASVGSSCPNATETVIAGSLAALFVLVPGGQQIYTRPDGAVGYTQAHSAYIPSGSYIDGYTNTTIYCGGPKTLLNFKAYDCEIGGIFACENVPYYMPNSSHQIYARTPGFNSTGCTELTGLLEHPWDTSKYGAWQYT